MTHSTTERSALSPYRLFEVEVRRVQRLSPSFLRVTFTGPDVDSFADNGYDQRIKLVLPLPGIAGFGHLEDGPDWFAHWRSLPDAQRNPIRTYTARAVRPGDGEVDVDFALHEEGGPAFRWASSADIGDVLAIVGPDAAYPGDHGGVDFHLPPQARTVLLAGDETAVPAIAAILERMPTQITGHALLEVPHTTDTWPITAPDGMRATWLGRNGAPHGSLLIPAVRAAAARFAGDQRQTGQALAEVDIDRDLLWEVPTADEATDLYAWLAGEAGAIKQLRRHLVTDLGIDRRSVAFMGYWRLGRSELTG